MMAMDVVDTLRHERMLITRDINSEVRRETLVDRLRDIYRGQGIEVPDDILLDGVKALEEERFRYQPPRPGLGTRLAHLYVNRRRWLPLLGTGLALVLAVWGVNEFGFERPAELREARAEQAIASTPAALDAAFAEGQATDPSPEALSALEQLRDQGLNAISNGDADAAQARLSDMQALIDRLEQAYVLDIVQPGSGELSAVDYVSPSGQDFFFAIVEASGPGGVPALVEVTDSLTGQTNTTSLFGVEISQDVYEDLARDLRDGQVDQDRLGEKVRGELEVDYERYVGELRLLEWGR